MNRRIVLPSWLPTFEDRAAKDQWLAGNYGLVKIAGNAGFDVLRCKRCNAKHPYLTLMCEPQPFDGATRGIYAWFHALGMSIGDMTPDEKRRFNNLAKTLKLGRLDVGSTHPIVAAQISSGPGAIDVGAVPLGMWEPIPRTIAQRLLDRINNTGLKPPLTIPGLLTHGKLTAYSSVVGRQSEWFTTRSAAP